MFTIHCVLDCFQQRTNIQLICLTNGNKLHLNGCFFFLFRQLLKEKQRMISRFVSVHSVCFFLSNGFVLFPTRKNTVLIFMLLFDCCFLFVFISFILYSVLYTIWNVLVRAHAVFFKCLQNRRLFKYIYQYIGIYAYKQQYIADCACSQLTRYLICDLLGYNVCNACVQNVHCI